MKLIVSALLSVSAFAKTKALPNFVDSIRADSNLGLDILSKSRKIEDDVGDYTWIQGYSLIFQGCHQVAQWNDEQDEAEDVRINTSRFVTYKLCPYNTCSSNGCKNGYGEYIVGLETFLESFLQNKEEVREYNCERFLENSCKCDGSDDRDENFDEEMCKYKCFRASGMNECIENDPYYDDAQDQDKLDIQDFGECQKFGGKENRVLEERGEEDEDIEYYLGPYCSNDGSKIFLGMFTDDTCTQFADEDGGAYTFSNMVGYALPYASSNIVDQKCYSCFENNNGNDDAADAIKETCIEMYKPAGKCETHLAGGTTDYPNEAACTYIQGVRTKSLSNGIISKNSKRSSMIAAFIFFFACTFFAMAWYVTYLRKKLALRRAMMAASPKSKKKRGFFKKLRERSRSRSRSRSPRRGGSFSLFKKNTKSDTLL